MPIDWDHLHWTPSPALAPDHGPVDLAHLQRMTFNDAVLEREVLAMFAAQSAVLMQSLARLPPDAAALAHKLKGSARAVGAHDVADAAERFEATQTAAGDDAPALAALIHAVRAARAAIDSLLNRS